jgi:hypothetical protein
MCDHTCYLILENDKVIFIGNRKGNVYKIKIDACMRIESCFITSINNSFLWHRRLGYISMDILSKCCDVAVGKINYPNLKHTR